jgi:hypothetical protein
VTTFSARDASFSKIIEDFRPRVPQLQRNYSWGPTQWKDLWDDLVGFYEDFRDDERPYFIGTVVLVSRGRLGTEILDGQQRLATLTIFLSALVEELKEYDPKYAAIFEETGIVSTSNTDKGEPYLVLNQYDGKFFRRFVQDRDFDTSPEIESHRLIKKAYAFFRDRITDYLEDTDLDGQKWLRHMGRLILHKVVFAYVLSDPSDSYQVFRVLNDRGRGLSQLDLFRTFLLQEAGDEAAAEIARNWTHILDIESPGSPDDLLRFYWVTQKGDVKSQRLFRNIKETVERKEKTAVSVAEELFFYSDIYKDLVTAVASNPQERALYQAIIDIRAKALYPLVMAGRYLVDSGEVPQKEYLMLLRMAVNLYVRHTVVCGLENFRLETVVYGAAREVAASRSVGAAITALRAFGAETVPDARFVADFEGCDIRSEAAAKSLLIALEQDNYNATEISILASRELHLEHIMPKKPSQAHKLTDHDHWLWKIGNLTLLDGTLNRKAGNKQFSDKRPIYGQSVLKLTNALTGLESWSPAEIATRQKALAQRASLVWSLDL